MLALVWRLIDIKTKVRDYESEIKNKEKLDPKSKLEGFKLRD